MVEHAGRWVRLQHACARDENRQEGSNGDDQGRADQRMVVVYAEDGYAAERKSDNGCESCYNEDQTSDTIRQRAWRQEAAGDKS